MMCHRVCFIEATRAITFNRCAYMENRKIFLNYHTCSYEWEHFQWEQLCGFHFCLLSQWMPTLKEFAPLGANSLRVGLLLEGLFCLYAYELLKLFHSSHWTLKVTSEFLIYEETSLKCYHEKHDVRRSLYNVKCHK